MTDARDDLVERLRTNSLRYSAETKEQYAMRRIETDREAATRIQQLTARAVHAEASLADAERVMHRLLSSTTGYYVCDPAQFEAARAWLDSRRASNT